MKVTIDVSNEFPLLVILYLLDKLTRVLSYPKKKKTKYGYTAKLSLN